MVLHVGVNALSVVPGVTGGGETYLVNLSRALVSRARNTRYTFLCTTENEALFTFPSSAANTTVLTVGGWGGTARALAESTVVPRRIRELGVDLYHGPTDVLPLWLPCPSVLTVQNALYLSDNASIRAPGDPVETVRSTVRMLYYRRRVIPSILASGAVIAVSSYIVGQILAKVSKRVAHRITDKLTVIPEAVDPVFREPASIGGPTVNGPYILAAAATFAPYKYIDQVITCFAELRRRHQLDHRLVIAGDGRDQYRHSLAQLAEKEGVGSDVTFTGAVSRLEMAALYRNADVFVTLSIVESFGLTVLEAMASGVPVVAANRGALPEVVADAGHLVDPDDAEAVVRSLARVLFDDAHRGRLKASGLRHAAAFSWERVALATEEVYRRVAEQRCSGG